MSFFAIFPDDKPKSYLDHAILFNEMLKVLCSGLYSCDSTNGNLLKKNLKKQHMDGMFEIWGSSILKFRKSVDHGCHEVMKMPWESNGLPK